MHIGICLNCRYIDLIENLGTAADSGVFCPRCGTEMSSLGVRSDEWNALTAKQKEKLVRERFPTHEDLFGPRVSPIIRELPEDERSDVNITEQQPADDTVEIMERYSEEELAEVSMYGPEDTQAVEEPEEADKPEQEPYFLDDDTLPDEEEEPAEEPESAPRDEYDIEQVYVCYKCNCIAGHDGSHEKYYCTECGSDMVNVGYTVRQWADLSKDAKRKVTEDAKIMHMVSEIKSEDYGVAGAEHTPSIINVVKDPDSDY